MVITMTHSEELKWNSEVEGSDSDRSTTSTPVFKRGMHDTEMSQIAQLLKGDCDTGLRKRGPSLYSYWRMRKWDCGQKETTSVKSSTIGGILNSG